MKTLFILHYPPPIHGAAIVGEYIKESELVNSTYNTKYINLSTSRSVEDIGKKGIIKIWTYFKILLSTFYYGLFWRPKLVYITISSRGAGLIKDTPIIFICRLLRLKHVFHFHNKGVKKYAQEKRWAKQLYKWIFKKADVILLSPLLYSDIEEYVAPKRVFYCPNGIEPDWKDKPKDKSSSSSIHLLFLSNLIKTKGIVDLLAVCEQLKSAEVKFNCTIIGGEGDISATELKTRIEQLNLSERVNYVGKKYGKDKHRFFQEADVFVHPTHEDCFPLVLLEAMQFGLPIISTDEGAIPEIVDDNTAGFIVPQKSPEVIVEKILDYTNDTALLQQHGANSRKKFEEKYTKEKFEKRLVTILDQLSEHR